MVASRQTASIEIENNVETRYQATLNETEDSVRVALRTEIGVKI
jgi:hypothetical protein